MFGEKDYEYHLELQGEIPTTIFKERNINIPLGLVDRNGQRVLNCKTFFTQPTSSTSALECVMPTDNGFRKIEQESLS